MKSSLICLLVLRLGQLAADRGTLTRNTDDEFQMLIAGGLVPDNSRYLRALVSIRTLRYIEYYGDNHFCTGVIISSRTILTAAQCVTDLHRSVVVPRSLLIVFGSTNRLDKYHNDETRRVSQIHIHPKFKRFSRYDVAVLRLVDIIPSNMRHVKPVRKRISGNMIHDMKCTTMGWGQVYPHGPYANHIMFLDVYIRIDDTCNDLENFNPELNICAVPAYEGEVCPGDLGSPLMCMNLLAGLIGGNQKCEGIKSIKFLDYRSVAKWVDNTVRLCAASCLKINLFPILWLHFVIYIFSNDY